MKTTAIQLLRMKEWREKNPDYQKEYQKRNSIRLRQYREERKEERAVYYRKWYAENGRERAVDYVELVNEWIKANIEKVRISRKFRYAVKKGLIKKPKLCESCGRERRLLGHHPDYNFPFKAEWLCYSCHKKLDYEN